MSNTNTLCYNFKVTLKNWKKNDETIWKYNHAAINFPFTHLNKKYEFFNISEKLQNYVVSMGASYLSCIEFLFVSFSLTYIFIGKTFSRYEPKIFFEVLKKSQGPRFYSDIFNILYINCLFDEFKSFFQFNDQVNSYSPTNTLLIC